MRTAEEIIGEIRQAFGANEYPGDLWIQGSREGSEPEEEVGPFVGRRRWEDLGAAMLDQHDAALSFFSEAGFRFFLPAFLVADVKGDLQAAEPLSHLVTGFSDGAVEIPVGSRTFTRRFGGSALMNPRRYGAIRSEDYARFRLAVFTREESGAIVSYLEFKKEQETIPALRDPIEAALDAFWRSRAASAPLARALQAHVEEDSAFLAAVRAQREGETGKTS